jgi:TetR/AcrR family transcriptional regulator
MSRLRYAGDRSDGENPAPSLHQSTPAAVTTPVEPSSARAERTRTAILAAAEELFASRGFASTRLEDVGDAVQMTRAALFYYFKDKQSLFDAVLEYSFGPLARQLEQALARDDVSIARRIEHGLIAWVDAIMGRPALARLILRLVADGTEALKHGVLSDNNQIAARFWSLYEQGRDSGELKPLHDDPFHTASAVIGSTVFYVAALSFLLPQGGFQPLDPQQAAAHKEEALLTMRHLLGIRESATDPP